MNEETIVWWYELFKLVVFLLIPVCFGIAIVGKIMEKRKRGRDEQPK